MGLVANVRGGRRYRLCPAESPLTEACFQSNHLEFVQDKQALLFGNGTRVPIPGVFVNVGTSPTNATWSRMPIPATGLGPRCSCDMDNNVR